MNKQNYDKYTYFISGGGTGGHIYPAVTILEALLSDESTDRIFYVGNPANLEFDIIKRYDKVTFLPVKIKGMPRKIGFTFVKWLWDLMTSTLKAIYYINKYKPNGVFATGGYVSAPVTLACSIIKKPFMIHDCDANPGLVSRLVAPFATVVSVSFDSAKKVLKSNKIILNGNPVRADFFKYSKDDAVVNLNLNRNKKTILAMGGSQGAKTINNAIVGLAKKLFENYDIQLIMQTGKKNYDEVISKLKEEYPDFENNKNFIVRPYFDEMVMPLMASDIVISRAGSVSLSEISLCGLASILVPYPYAAADHQKKNAQEVCNKGAALYLDDSECNPETMYEKIKYLLDNEDIIIKMSDVSKSLANKNSTMAIINELKSTIK